ncbi:glycosyltransferase [Candidatus Woesearchaeota archaeon]|jgi:glycosyltransferase involved in cell wall biosynthesis/organic radical activating enzyme|nr:glycosyltransferase [Candidatus Woesearchaeota archaeon]
MKVSVIIPTRNMSKLLGNTLNALILQKTKDVEIIVVDDDSCDNTKEVIQKYSQNVKYYYLDRKNNSKKRRVAEIRNYGVKKAKGEILIFLDADMVVQEDFINEHIKSHENSDIVLGLRYDLDKKRKVVDQKDKRESYFIICDDQINNLVAPWVLLYSHNFSVSKEAFDYVAGFSIYFDRWGVEDQELGYKLFKEGFRFSLNKKAIAYHQYHVTEYVNKLEKKTNLIVNCKKFYEKYNDSYILKFFGLDKKVLRLEITDKCNNRCEICSNIEKKGSIITKKEIEGSLDLIDRDWKIILTGGEPTINSDFFEIIDIIKEKGFENVEIETNGRALSYNSFCKKCILGGIYDYSVYVFGHNEEIHDKITKFKGSFKQTVKGIENLIGLKQGVAVNIVLNEINFMHFKEILDFYKIKGVIIFYLTFALNDKNKFVFYDMKNHILGRKGLIFKNIFLKCYLDFKESKNELTVEKMKGCSKCVFVEECNAKPELFFSKE